MFRPAEAILEGHWEAVNICQYYNINKGFKLFLILLIITIAKSNYCENEIEYTFIWYNQSIQELGLFLRWIKTELSFFAGTTEHSGLCVNILAVKLSILWHQNLLYLNINDKPVIQSEKPQRNLKERMLAENGTRAGGFNQ